MIRPQPLSLPLRRNEGLSCQQVGEETLVYDEHTHQAYCLNATAALVWKHCDGTQTPQQLAAIVSRESDALTAEATVRLALARLAKDDLITGYMPSTLPVVSRRTMRRTMLAQGGAGLVLMLPVIAMIAVPKAAQAYSGCFNCSPTPAASAQRSRWGVAEQRKSSQGSSGL